MFLHDSPKLVIHGVNVWTIRGPKIGTLVLGSTNMRPEQPNFDTATETIIDLLKVGLVRKSRSAANSHFFVIVGTYTQSLCKLTGGDTEKIFSSVKNTKSTADAGKRRSSFCTRVRHKAQFVTVSSCAWRFFKHFNLKLWRTIRYTEEWWIPVSREIWRVVLWLFGAPSWLKINSLTESTLSSVRALRGHPLPWRLLL